MMSPAGHGLSQNAIDSPTLRVPDRQLHGGHLGRRGGLIVCAQIATRTMKDVPEGSQNFLELLVETL